MPGTFYDTSVLGKRYHRETGTARVDQLLADPGTKHFISRLSAVEVYSVFAKKVRAGTLALAGFQLLGRRFRSDVARQRPQVVRVTSLHFRAAEQLIRRIAPANNLRTLDALQLAVALDLRDKGLIGQFVCADQSLCSLASAEGLTVINPEVP